jgi:hypothetical protein
MSATNGKDLRIALNKLGNHVERFHALSRKGAAHRDYWLIFSGIISAYTVMTLFPVLILVQSIDFEIFGASSSPKILIIRGES